MIRGEYKVLLVLENVRRSISHSKVTWEKLRIQSLLMRIVEMKNFFFVEEEIDNKSKEHVHRKLHMHLRKHVVLANIRRSRIRDHFEETHDTWDMDQR